MYMFCKIKINQRSYTFRRKSCLCKKNKYFLKVQFQKTKLRKSPYFFLTRVNWFWFSTTNIIANNTFVKKKTPNDANFCADIIIANTCGKSTSQKLVVRQEKLQKNLSMAAVGAIKFSMEYQAKTKSEQKIKINK